MKNLLLFSLFFFAFSLGYSQNSNQQGTGDVIYCTEFQETRPLSEIVNLNPFVEEKTTKVKESGDRAHRTPQTFVFSPADGAIYGNDPSTMQTTMGKRMANENRAPIINWAGQVGSYRPNDPTGAAGPNHYIQSVNATPFKVFNKTTGANLLTANIGSLWSPATGNEGDPIIMYDKYADRWFISQFGTSSDKKIYIAISKTNDPTGAYYTYTFTSPTFPDYLKFSIWENGYYMTSNGTSRVFCFERTKMLAGDATARAVSATFTPGSNSGFYCPLPGDAADGGLPAVGTPLPFFAYSENAWGTGIVDGVKIWNMTVNWGTTPTATIALNTTVPTAAFDASYDSGWNDIIQPGSQKLDGIGGVPTFRAQWRPWTGYNTVLLNWGVKISSTQRSIKWVELRQNTTTGVWSLYQEGTYSPDTHSRWLGSIAMDNNGSIALAYAKSSSTVYPSLCYTGRLASDPLGTMSFAETVAMAGTSSETSANRYGDYSHTSLDPSDGLTFWHTGEYTSSGTKTRIYSFKLPLPVTTTASVVITQTVGTSPFCAGISVTYTASPTNGGTTPTYQWKVDGANAGTGVTFTTSTLTNGQVITCVMTSNLAGVTGSPATSNSITAAVTAAVTPSVSISTPITTVCAGASVTFTAVPTNGGTTPSYQWKVNNVNAGTNSTTFTTTALTNGQVVTCVMTSNATCASPTAATSTGITMTVNTTVTPTVYIAITSGSNPTCTGASVTFTATPVNGGTTPSYQWKVGTTNVGTNSNTYTTTALTNGQVVTCVMTSNATCASPTTATSTGITMTVNTTVAPTVSIAITSGSNPTCTGASVTFTATPVNGGTTPSYQWKVGTTNVGTNSNTYTTTALTNGQVVTCVMTSNTTCASPTTATSAGITMTVNTTVAPTASIAITSGSNPTCAGVSVTFTATPVNGGTTPSYQWKVGTTNVGTNSNTYTTTALTNGQVVTCVITSNLACASPTTATSAGITMTVNTTVVPTVSIAITSGSNPICEGASVTFTATPVNGGTTPSYQWKINGVNAGTNSATFESSSLTNTQIVTCILTSNAVCVSQTTVTSTGITMTVNPILTPTVSITADAITICDGAQVIFTPTPVNGGTPTYQWKLNGSDIATGATYSNSSLANGNTVSCVMTSTEACVSSATATSNTVTMTVNPILTPSVEINADPAIAVCPGESILFTANPANGGTPTYQWTVDGVNAGTNATLSGIYNNGQVIACTMTSTANCANPSVVSATPKTVTIYNVTPVTISEASGVLTSSATSGNQWYEETLGIINNATSQTYTPIADGHYYVVVTDANSCDVTSNVINFIYTGIDNVTEVPTIKLYPNPTNGIVNISFGQEIVGDVMIENIIGKKVYIAKVNQTKDSVKAIDLSKFASGTYFVIIKNEKLNLRYKVIYKSK